MAWRSILVALQHFIFTGHNQLNTLFLFIGFQYLNSTQSQATCLLNFINLFSVIKICRIHFVLASKVILIDNGMEEVKIWLLSVYEIMKVMQVIIVVKFDIQFNFLFVSHLWNIH